MFATLVANAVVAGGPSRLAVKRLKQNGSPRVLVIASGAIRCTHIIKALHSVADGSPVSCPRAPISSRAESALCASSNWTWPALN